MLGKINTYNDWDPLREIIVGTAEGSCGPLEWKESRPVSADERQKALELARFAFPQWYLGEIAEDLEGLCDTLLKLGVTVHRPSVYDLSVTCSSPYWSATGNNSYNVRDLHLVVGNTVIESPSPFRFRYFETSMLYPIWYKYLDKGFRWIIAPKPKLDYEPLTNYFPEGAERILTSEDIQYRELTQGRLETLHRLSEREILFEAANTLRLGRDLLYLVSSSGNRRGANWLQSILGDKYRVHTNDQIYRSSHIDSTILALRPGLVLINSIRVTPTTCPELFDKWDKIYFSEVAPTPAGELEFQSEVRDPIARQLRDLGIESTLGVMASPWVGMNLLSVDPQTVIVDARQLALIRTLEAHRLTVIPVRMRHMNTQLGGIHCATLDTVREGNLENYFD
jgi:glycine amidinotransferase